MKKSILLLFGYLFFLMICFLAFAQTARKQNGYNENFNYIKSLEMPTAYRHLVLKGDRESQITVSCWPQETSSTLEGILEDGVLEQHVSNDTLYLTFTGSNHYRYLDLSVPPAFQSIVSDGIQVQARTRIFQGDQPGKISIRNSHNDQRNVLDLILDQPDKAIALDLDQCNTTIRHENSNATPPLYIYSINSRIQFNELISFYPSPITIVADDASFVSGNFGVTKALQLTPLDEAARRELLKWPESLKIA